MSENSQDEYANTGTGRAPDGVSGAASGLPDISRARAFLRISGENEDGLISKLLQTAQHFIESRTGRLLSQRTELYFLDKWPHSRMIILPYSPVSSVSRISLHEADGGMRTLSEHDFRLDKRSEPARLHIKPGITSGSAVSNAVEIEYRAGYSSDKLPADLCHAVLMLSAHWFNHREAALHNAPVSLPLGINALLATYRIPRL